MLPFVRPEGKEKPYPFKPARAVTDWYDYYGQCAVR